MIIIPCQKRFFVHGSGMGQRIQLLFHFLKTCPQIASFITIGFLSLSTKPAKQAKQPQHEYTAPYFVNSMISYTFSNQLYGGFYIRLYTYI